MLLIYSKLIEEKVKWINDYKLVKNKGEKKIKKLFKSIYIYIYIFFNKIRNFFYFIKLFYNINNIHYS